MRVIIYLDGPEKEFKRQAEAAERYWKASGHEVLTIPIKSTLMPAGKQRCLEKAMQSASLYVDVVAFFCHGTPMAINSIGWNWYSMDRLVEILHPWECINQTIALFACNTGARKDGFAATLAAKTKCRVLAHSTRGHTTGNPNKWIFDEAHPRGIYAAEALGIEKGEWKRMMVAAKTDDTELDVLERVNNWRAE